MTLLEAGLVAAAALHLGFQLTVTLLVYPALGEVDPANWAQAHARHSRRIVPLVGATYGLLVVALVGALVDGPDDSWLATAGFGALLTVLTTAFLAAPLHGRLGRRGPDDALIRRLRRVDLARLLGAALATVGALGWTIR